MDSKSATNVPSISRQVSTRNTSEDEAVKFLSKYLDKGN